MVFVILSSVAEMERQMIVERVRAGLRNARAKGKTLGRPRVAVDAAGIGPAARSGPLCAADRRRARVQPRTCTQNPCKSTGSGLDSVPPVPELANRFSLRRIIFVEHAQDVGRHLLEL